MSTTDSLQRKHLQRELEAHLAALGYSSTRTRHTGSLVPEIIRVNPVRCRVVYGETILPADLTRPKCHERLLSFSQRRTRHRSSILFFIGVSEADQLELEELLRRLEIRSGVRGGHVHVVPIAPPQAAAIPARARRRKSA